jgi:DNA polymerase (family 10)
LKGFTVLAGVEVNIKADGSPDIENRVLRDMDIVVASVH